MRTPASRDLGGSERRGANRCVVVTMHDEDRRVDPVQVLQPPSRTVRTSRTSGLARIGPGHPREPGPTTGVRSARPAFGGSFRGGDRPYSARRCPSPALHDTGPFAPCPAPFNLAAYVLAASARTPGKVALEVLSAPGTVAERWRYADLAEAVTRTAGGLAARGIGRGDRVLHPDRQQLAVPDRLLRRQRPRSGAGADLGGADGARDRRGHRLGRAAPRLPRAGPRPPGGAGRGGDRAGRGRRPPRGTSPRRSRRRRPTIRPTW